MKIILVRQADTQMQWAARCDAAAFERALAEERDCPAVPVEVKKGDASRYVVWTGSSRASAETAELLFTFKETPQRTPLLDDVPLCAFRSGGSACPPGLWRSMGQAQWLLGSGRQSETRAQTLRRVGELIDALEREDRDCILICRGLTLSALKTALRRRGYCIEGGDLLPKPLERIRATKRTLHCGGCHHNCLLTEPKCQIGRNKAAGNL